MSKQNTFRSLVHYAKNRIPFFNSQSSPQLSEIYSNFNSRSFSLHTNALHVTVNSPLKPSHIYASDYKSALTSKPSSSYPSSVNYSTAETLEKESPDSPTSPPVPSEGSAEASDKVVQEEPVQEEEATSTSSPPLGKLLKRRPEKLQPGVATSEGTAAYASKFASLAGSGHFKTFKSGDASRDLQISSVGVGNYLSTYSYSSVKYLSQIISMFIENGSNVIDIPYSFEKFDTEHAIGNTVASMIASGEISRSELVICSKGGIIHRKNRKFSSTPEEYYTKNYVSRGLFSLDDLAGRHCLAPTFIKHQLENSLKHIGLESLDFYYLQNLELHLEHLNDKDLFYERLTKAFEYLESACNEKKIGYYGVTCKHTCFTDENSPVFVSLERLHQAAVSAGGENNHFKLLQVPYNLANQVVGKAATQTLNGSNMTVLEAASQLGLNVVTSASNFNMRRYKFDLAEAKDFDTSKFEDASEDVKALQFSRMSPYVLSAMVSAKGTDQVKKLLKVVVYNCEQEQQEQNQQE